MKNLQYFTMIVFAIMLTALHLSQTFGADALTKPIVAPELVFEERDGIVAIEAEHFSEQTLFDVRAWYLTTKDKTPAIEPDGDGTWPATAQRWQTVTLLAYEDFDDTVALKAKSPIKTWQPHVKDWKNGDPTWKNGKGKGLIGGINYLSTEGCNSISFLPYNAGGDGDNIWPFVQRDDKLHYDCSKLD